MGPPPHLPQLRRGRKMASLSERESEESRSRRRAGFRVIKGGAAGGGIDTNTVTDLTKLPPGFLEGGWWGLALRRAAALNAAAVSNGRAGCLGLVSMGHLPASPHPTRCATLPHPCRRLPHSPCSVPCRHPPGGVRRRGQLWGGVASRVLRRAGGRQDPGQGESLVVWLWGLRLGLEGLLA